MNKTKKSKKNNRGKSRGQRATTQTRRSLRLEARQEAKKEQDERELEKKQQESIQNLEEIGEPRQKKRKLEISEEVIPEQITSETLLLDEDKIEDADKEQQQPEQPPEQPPEQQPAAIKKQTVSFLPKINSKQQVSVSYDKESKNIIVKCDDTERTYSDITNLSFEGKDMFDIQRELRYLDSKKDLLGVSNLDHIISKAYNLNERDIPAYSKLDKIKKTYINRVALDGFIETKSWAKTKARNSLEIKLGETQEDSFIFRESGMYLNDDTTVGCIDMSCFSNTILDPFVRSFQNTAEHFPSMGVNMTFESSFLQNLLCFYNSTLLSSTLSTSESSDKNMAIYNYKYQFNSWETQIKGETKYPGRLPSDNPLNTYVIGNENKNAFLSQIQGKSGKDNTKYIIIQTKEMGDVLQVFTMLAWYICQNNGNKKNFLMTTIDSIVFLSSIMFQMPCIVYEFKNEGLNETKQKEEKGRTRYLQRYLPQIFTVSDKIVQTINEIQKFNNNVKSVITQIINSPNPIRVYISKSETKIMNTKFLQYIVYIIDLLNSISDYVSDVALEKEPNRQNIDAIKQDILAIRGELFGFDETKGEDSDEWKFNPLLEELTTDVKMYIEKNVPEQLALFLQKLKVLFTIYEIFYVKHGLYYASTMVTFLTQCRQSDESNSEYCLFFPCNNSPRMTRGKLTFSIWCVRNSPQRGGSQDGKIQYNNNTLSFSNGRINFSSYDPCTDNWNLNIDVNMYKYLLDDIYDIAQKAVSRNFFPDDPNIILSDYILYEMYTQLAFHFNICNQVFYPKDQQYKIADALPYGGNVVLPEYLFSSNTNIYLEDFIEAITNDFFAYIVNQIKNDKNNKDEIKLDDFIGENKNKTIASTLFNILESELDKEGKSKEEKDQDMIKLYNYLYGEQPNSDLKLDLYSANRPSTPMGMGIQPKELRTPTDQPISKMEPGTDIPSPLSIIESEDEGKEDEEGVEGLDFGLEISKSKPLDSDIPIGEEKADLSRLATIEGRIYTPDLERIGTQQTQPDDITGGRKTKRAHYKKRNLKTRKFGKKNKGRTFHKKQRVKKYTRRNK